MIQLKRAYDSVEASDGVRYLVERLWPRGIKKADLPLDAWLKDVSPAPELRTWFSHDPEKWPEFQQRYRAQLDAAPASWKPILEAARQGKVTLIYSARDTEHNSALLLKGYLDKKLQK
jgi:uncharacterized protein YeaO (DUF488 family)